MVWMGAVKLKKFANGAIGSAMSFEAQRVIIGQRGAILLTNICLNRW
jgi:hypothetical protein